MIKLILRLLKSLSLLAQAPLLLPLIFSSKLQITRLSSLHRILHLTRLLPLLLSSLLIISSCAHQNVYVNKRVFNVEPTYIYSQPFFLWGIFQTRDTSARDICRGQELSYFSVGQNWKDILLSLVTAGIYTPRTVEVYCRELDKNSDEDETEAKTK